jgi:ABC-2 type transport system permease protein
MHPTMPLFLRATLARAYPRVIGLWREPSWVLQETLMPLLSVSAFVFVYRAMLHGPSPFEGFVLLGGAMTAFWLNVLWAMGAQLYWERDGGNLELYIIAPGSMMAILAGMALGGIIMTMVRAVVILAIGSFLFGVHFGHAETNWWQVAGVFVLTLVALYGLGMCFASAFLMWGREAWHTVALLQEPVYFLAGINYPVRSLGVGVATAAALLPVTLGMDALRQLLFADPRITQPLITVEWEMAALAVMAVIYLWLARRLLAYLERRARQEGRLTVRGQ